MRLAILRSIIEDLVGSVESINFLQLRLILEAASKATGIPVGEQLYFGHVKQALGRLRPNYLRAIEFTADDTMTALDLFNERNGSGAQVYGGFCAFVEDVIDTLVQMRGIKPANEFEKKVLHQNLAPVVLKHLENNREEMLVEVTDERGRKKKVRCWKAMPLEKSELPTMEGMFAPTETAYSTQRFLAKREAEDG
jgi:hypothetical protein